MDKKILYILRKPPYQGALAQETLDILLTLAAFDQFVNLLFLDDAVFQLKAGQHPAGWKNIGTSLNALALYGIDKIYVEAEALSERGLVLSDLTMAVVPLNRADLGEFCQHYTTVLTG